LKLSREPAYLRTADDGVSGVSARSGVEVECFFERPLLLNEEFRVSAQPVTVTRSQMVKGESEVAVFEKSFEALYESQRMIWKARNRF
jgi:hypothetical protein